MHPKTISTEPPPIVHQLELRQIASTPDESKSNEIVFSKRQRPWFSRWGLFLITVALPTLCAAAYLFAIAADIYVSEARFVVKSTGSNEAASIIALIQNQGLSRAADETYAVGAYMRSRDAVDRLSKTADLAAVLSRPEGDIINRFPNFYSRETKEALYRHFQTIVTTELDGSTGISTLTVAAFRPDDARNIASALLRSAEELVNQLNERAHRDSLRYARQMVEEATADLLAAEERLTIYRNKEKIIDTEREAASALESLAQLSIELAQAETALDQQRRIAPASPGIRSLDEKITAYRRRIDELRSHLAGPDGSLASKMSEYDVLVLRRTLAAKALGAATLSLEKAKQTAQTQHLYLQTIVQPNLPDQAKYPKRLLWFFAVCFITLTVYSILVSIARIVLEHRE